MLRLVLVAILVMAPSAGFCERANLFISLYGISTDREWTFDVRLQSGAALLDRPAEYLQRPQIEASSTQFGWKLKMPDVFFAPGNEATLISIRASFISDNGGDPTTLYFPVHLIDRDVSSGENISIDFPSMRGYFDRTVAVRSSYPFFNGEERVDLNASNIISALNAVREIVRSLDPGREGWNEIYFLFNRNTYILVQENHVLRKIIDILHDYYENSVDEGFVDFYMTFLSKMISQDLGDSVHTDSGILMNDYIVQEISSVFRQNPERAYMHLVEILEGLEEIGEYERCISLATASFNAIAASVKMDSSMWRSKSGHELAGEIYTGMIISTRCSQKIFVLEDAVGSQRDVLQGARFIVRRGDAGRQFASSFVELFDVLRRNDVLSMSNRNVSDFEYHFRQELSAMMGG